MGSCKRMLAMALTLALGSAFMPLGCGGSGGGFSPGAPVQRDAQVPAGVALELRGCAARHMAHLGHAHPFVSFDVKLANDGQVDEVALRASTLGDEELEACMAHALRSLSEDDLSMRLSENLRRGPVAPESRALLGNPAGVLAAAACVAQPELCVFVLGVMSLTVWIYVQPSVHPGTRTHHPPAVTTPPVVSAAPMPTTTAVPTTTAIPKPCLPCLPVPVGGTAYEYHSAAAGNDPHKEMANHTHHFRMQQSPPAAGCRCFWQRNFIEPTPDFSPLPGAVPISPAVGGEIAP